MRIFRCLICAIALCPLAACNKARQGITEATGNVAGSSKDGIIVTADVPTERDGATYCTVMANRSYDIPMKDDSTGEVVMILDRVCANYSEAYVGADAPKIPAAHTLDAKYAFTVKKSSREYVGLTFQSEFFEQAHRITMHMTTSSKAVSFGCTAVPISRVTNGHDQLLVPNGPAILKNASDSGILHIQG